MSTEDKFNSLVANIDKHIKYIESDINRSNVTKETIDLFNKLNEERKELFSANVDKNILNPIKKEYGTRLLALKKSLVYYYNNNVVLMVYMLKEMISKIEIIDYKKERELLLKELNSFEIPRVYDKNINNFQDPINIDFDEFIYISNAFNKFKEKILIDENNLGEIEIGYVNRYAIPKIYDLVERYNSGERIITKQSINLDILLCRIKIRDIERKYKDNDKISNECLKARNKLDELNIIVTKTRMKPGNSEYYSLKNEIIVFGQEIDNYYLNADKVNFYKDLPEFKTRYDAFVVKIEKYKNTDKQLYNNLISSLEEINGVIKKIEMETKPKAENINNGTVNDDLEEDKYYRVETIEEANDFYKRYSKAIMLASAVASIALISTINTSVGLVVIPTIIFANVVAANRYAIIDKINRVLEKAIKAKCDSNGNVIKQNGIKLGVNDAINGLLKSIALLDKKNKKAIKELIAKVRNSSIVVKTLERTSNMRKQEVSDLTIAKLYYDFVLSNQSMKEFCKKRKISDDVRVKLIDYMQYKDENDRGLKR